MNKPIKVNKTMNVTIDGKAILVDALPAEVRFEIETLDHMMQRVRDIEFDYEVISIAARAKQVHVEQLLKNLFAAKEQPANDTSASDQITSS